MFVTAPYRSDTSVRWPMAFRLSPATESFLAEAPNHIEASHEYDASPERVHRSFLAFAGDPPWSPGFRGVDWWTPPGELDHAVMDELYTFMRMRVHVVEHELGVRSVAYVSRWSLPLATRMVQLIELSRLPNGRTRLDYRVGYAPPKIFTPFVPPVAWAFRRWFEVSLERLAHYLATHPE